MPRTVYKCELCGEEYNYRAECEEHEKIHPIPTAIAGWDGYAPYNYADSRRYPVCVKIRFSDGSLQLYERKM